MPLYKKKGTQAFVPWTSETVMQGVSISEADIQNGSPKQGDMIAINSKDPTDRWLVAEQFFKNNYEQVIDIFEPKWPEDLEQNSLYEFNCDDACLEEEQAVLRVVVGDDGDVYVSMIQINLEHNTVDPFPSVRCRTFIGGGRHERTRQALLWLAQAMRLDSEENK